MTKQVPIMICIHRFHCTKIHLSKGNEAVVKRAASVYVLYYGALVVKPVIQTLIEKGERYHLVRERQEPRGQPDRTTFIPRVLLVGARSQGNGKSRASTSEGEGQSYRFRLLAEDENLPETAHARGGADMERNTTCDGWESWRTLPPHLRCDVRRERNRHASSETMV